MRKNFVLFILLQLCLEKVVLGEVRFKYKAILDHMNLVRLEWSLDKVKAENLIVFRLTVFLTKTPAVIGFGFSDRGGPENADIVLINVHLLPDNNQIIDAHTNSDGVLIPDSKENYLLLEFEIDEEPGTNRFKVTVVLERKLDSCDSFDYKIETGTVHTIHFIETQSSNHSCDKLLDTLLSSGFKLTEDRIEMKQVQLVKSSFFDGKVSDVLSQSNYFDVKTENINLPNADTTYWCKVHKLEPRFNLKHHIVGFESQISENSKGIVHHMELFHCVTDPSEEARDYNAPCNSEAKPLGLTQCRKVVAAWAMGAGVFVYPDNVGGVIGGESYSPYLVLEIHYDNRYKRDDIVDSSGMRIYYESGKRLRKYDAGILEVGLEYNSKNSIPPNSVEFHLHGHCLGTCTKAALPSQGIFVFASQLHTHLTGRRVWTSLIRNGKMIQVVNSDNHFDQMFQEIRLLKKPVNIRPGDAILNTCVYNTESRTNMTLGGFSIRDEMCVNYMHYYPACELEVCKSSIADDTLDTFFEGMRRYEFANTSADFSLSQNFNGIRWTPLTSAILSNLYDKAPIAFSCNSSLGTNIPQVYKSIRNGDERKYFQPIDVTNMPSKYAPEDPKLDQHCRN